jgi:hypothetical protein
MCCLPQGNVKNVEKRQMLNFFLNPNFFLQKLGRAEGLREHDEGR